MDKFFDVTVNIRVKAVDTETAEWRVRYLINDGIIEQHDHYGEQVFLTTRSPKPPSHQLGN